MKKKQKKEEDEERVIGKKMKKQKEYTIYESRNIHRERSMRRKMQKE